MKFLCDMGISPRTSEWLTAMGYDSIHLSDEGLHRLPDDEIFRKAAREKRIILTVDLDFGYLVARSGLQLPSVIIFRTSDKTPQSIQSKLSIILEKASGELLNGAILSVNDNDFRVTSLPISLKRNL
jgi:predicted nuclease of predicted toxin-antitoxin system